jgi:hypothetical protein
MGRRCCLWCSDPRSSGGYGLLGSDFVARNSVGHSWSTNSGWRSSVVRNRISSGIEESTVRCRRCDGRLWCSSARRCLRRILAWSKPTLIVVRLLSCCPRAVRLLVRCPNITLLVIVTLLLLGPWRGITLKESWSLGRLIRGVGGCGTLSSIALLCLLGIGRIRVRIALI